MKCACQLSSSKQAGQMLSETEEEESTSWEKEEARREKPETVRKGCGKNIKSQKNKNKNGNNLPIILSSKSRTGSRVYAFNPLFPIVLST